MIRKRVSPSNDGFLMECMKISSLSADYIENLTRVIKKEFMTGKIDRYSYERQINLITVIKLQVEHITDLAKEQVRLGAVIDVKV